jgi:hypothetical protein
VTGAKTISVGGSVGDGDGVAGRPVDGAGAGGAGAIVGAGVATKAADGATVGIMGPVVGFDEESGTAESCDVEEEEGRLE